MPIEINDVSYTYNEGTAGAYEALSGISVTVERGEWIAVIGHTGSGKSTLAQHMNALLVPQRGTVTIDGTVVKSGAKDLRGLRRKVGLVFQYPEQQFFAETVKDEIAYAPANWGIKGDELDMCVQGAAKAVGLDMSLMGKNPFALSGGQRRRVALASVIAMSPDYLVLDEPTAGLDASGIRELASLLRRICEMGLGIVQITHDLQSAMSESSRILVLERGRGVFTGSPEEVASFLLGNPVKGLVIPPLVRFCDGLRRRGVDIALTSDITAIAAVLEDIK